MKFTIGSLVKVVLFSLALQSTASAQVTGMAVIFNPGHSISAGPDPTTAGQFNQILSGRGSVTILNKPKVEYNQIIIRSRLAKESDRLCAQVIAGESRLTSRRFAWAITGVISSNSNGSIVVDRAETFSCWVF